MAISFDEKMAWKLRCRKTKTKRLEAGLCYRCGLNTFRPNRQTCGDCAAKRSGQIKNNYDLRRKDELCVRCSAPRCGGVLCENCYLKRVSLVNLGTQVRWQELKTIFVNQNGICPYTGRSLRLGYDTSLDHLIPKSRGGTDAGNNLQWVYTEINTMKSNFLHQEFLDLILEISNHTSG